MRPHHECGGADAVVDCASTTRGTSADGFDESSRLLVTHGSTNVPSPGSAGTACVTGRAVLVDGGSTVGT